MKKKQIISFLIIGLFILTVGVIVLRFVIGRPEDGWICNDSQWVKHGNPTKPMPTGGCVRSNQTQVANPASVYCKQQGGESIIQTTNDGSQLGWCKLNDGRICDEWQYFRNQSCDNQTINATSAIKP
jgi:putative hemolysin